MNSSFADKVLNDNLRCIKWEHKHGSIPAILDEEDYVGIEKSNQLFARKMEHPFSTVLVSKLMENK